jgi:hypothetical protein
MPPLTWQQVSAPNFSGVTEAQRLAGAALSDGFSSAINAVDKFGVSQKANANGELLARISSFGKPEDLRAALANGSIFEGLDRNAISPETFDRANAQTAALLSDTQTGVQTDGFRLDNQGKVLDNDNQREANSLQSWTNNNTKAVEAARPAAVARANEIRMLQRDGKFAEAAALERESSDEFSAAGFNVTEMENFVNGGVETAEGGIGLRTAQIKEVGDFRTFDEDNAARDAGNAALAKFSNNPQLAAEEIRNSGLSPSVTQKALALVAGYEGNSKPTVTRQDLLAQEQMDAVLNGTAEATAASAAVTDSQQLTQSAMTKKDPLATTEIEALGSLTDQTSYNADNVVQAIQVTDAWKQSTAAEALLDPSLQAGSREDTVSSLLTTFKENDVDIQAPELRQNIKTLEEKYGLSPGQAAWVIKNAVDREVWIWSPIQGQQNLNFTDVEEMLSHVWDKDAKTPEERAKRGRELLTENRNQKTQLEKLASERAAVAEAEAEFINLRNQAGSNPSQAMMAKVTRAQFTWQAMAAKFEKTVENMRGVFGEDK